MGTDYSLKDQKLLFRAFRMMGETRRTLSNPDYGTVHKGSIDNKQRLSDKQLKVFKDNPGFARFYWNEIQNNAYYQKSLSGWIRPVRITKNCDQCNGTGKMPGAIYGKNV